MAGAEFDVALTWMSCFPNSFARLWDRARTANFPEANALVVTFPRMLAVAPVNTSVPFAPVDGAGSFFWNARIAARAKANEPSMFTLFDSRTSSGVTWRKGFHTAWPALKIAAVIAYSGDG